MVRISDGRINQFDLAAPFVAYCVGGNVTLYSSAGAFLYQIPSATAATATGSLNAPAGLNVNGNGAGLITISQRMPNGKLYSLVVNAACGRNTVSLGTES